MKCTRSDDLLSVSIANRRPETTFYFLFESAAAAVVAANHMKKYENLPNATNVQISSSLFIVSTRFLG